MTGDDNEPFRPIRVLTIGPTRGLRSSKSLEPNRDANRLNLISKSNPEQILNEKPCKASDSGSEQGSSNCSSSLSPIASKAKHCGPNSRLFGESCLCHEGYRKFPFSELCVKDKGQPCVFQENDCHTDMTNMVCTNNVCSCDDSDVYDPITSRCIGKVGGLCFPGIKDCTLNAECLRVPSKRSIRKRREVSSNYYYYQADSPSPPESDYIFSSSSDIEISGRCQCMAGFVESADGSCKKGYGQPCKSSNECDTLNLVCREGVCSCPDSLQVYDNVGKSCLALVGAKCSDEPGGTACVKLAFCHKPSLKVGGTCVCGEDSEETDLRTCARFGASAAPPLAVLLSENHKSNRILFGL